MNPKVNMFTLCATKCDTRSELVSTQAQHIKTNNALHKLNISLNNTGNMHGSKNQPDLPKSCQSRVRKQNKTSCLMFCSKNCYCLYFWLSIVLNLTNPKDCSSLKIEKERKKRKKKRPQLYAL